MDPEVKAILLQSQQSIQALLNANMTVMTFPTLTHQTFMPSRPKVHEWVYFGCSQAVPRADCVTACQRWRRGTNLECHVVESATDYCGMLSRTQKLKLKACRGAGAS